ncbi:MAG: twin-arginine translocase subunit TatB [Gallionellaceae bacterium]|nr:MAG: twin-arginine translocase subunit TatB [Gallionellaceae bacterium]
MFDIGFSEIVVIAVVALIVIGPERLPKVARTLGHLWGRAQRYVNGVKADISRDMALEELRQMQQKVQQEATAAQQAFTQTAQQVSQHVQQLNDAVAQSAQDAAKEIQAPARSVPNKPPQAPEQQKFPID